MKTFFKSMYCHSESYVLTASSTIITCRCVSWWAL